LADANDLVLILGDNVKRTWKQIIYFNAGAHVENGATKAPASIDLPESDGFTFSDNFEIISDERGVRIAREESD
jgi:cyanophycin synthetase